MNLKRILKINKQSKLIRNILEYPLVRKMISITKEYILDAPQFFYKESTKNIDLAPFLELPGSYFTVYCYYPRTIVIVFLEIPLTLVASAFLFDNVFSNNFNIFLLKVFCRRN